MKYVRALIRAFFGHYTTSRTVRGGSGHYNEQCHPGTYN